MALRVNPVVNGILTFIFLSQVVGVFMSVFTPGMLPPGSPLTSSAAGCALLASCAMLFPTIFLVKRISGAAGALASRTILKSLGDPLRKHRTLRKFEDQCWQLAIHVGMTLLEVYILYYDAGGEDWLWDYVKMWNMHHNQVNSKASIHVLYMIQMAIWIVTCTSHRFIEEYHKDYVMMYIHHLVTIALIWMSYSANFVRIGIVVLLLHDSSDIVIDLLKLTNYMKLEGLRCGFIVELCFVSNFFTWFYTRLYLYPVYVVWYGGWYGTRELVTSPGYPGMEEFTRQAGSEYTRGHAPGFQLQDGSFDFWTSLRVLPTHSNLPLYWVLNPLLTALLAMHVIWYLLFWRLLYRIVNKEAPSEAGREEYEGDSDDD
uniref:TLC domain-containing protein n=1 Tax=Calcidiscus leptoporus TaxID=127549 RepID=A0A7S0IMP8_9EUKA|mmetsp:Transcript_13446/g.30892  ORF Transcript_13446/g.30892 Transcript_13446/m.30892 type:complete len:372 (+) Transcript_13446:44-1159(+)